MECHSTSWVLEGGSTKLGAIKIKPAVNHQKHYTIFITLGHPLYPTIAEQNISSKTQAKAQPSLNRKQVVSRATLNKKIVQPTSRTRIKYETWFTTGSTCCYSVSSMPVSSFWRPISSQSRYCNEVKAPDTNSYKMSTQCLCSCEISKYQIAFISYSFCMDFCEYYPIYFCIQ